LLRNWQACYKCNMRRWMRDRGKRRKQPTNEQPPQEKPEPLQPRFPDREDTNGLPQEAAPEPSPEVNDEAGGMDSPFASEATGDEGEGSPQQPARAQRSRRRGRRGRGSRPATPGQAPTLPAPGGPTGEAAEAEAPPEANEPAVATPSPAQSAAAAKSKGAVVLSIGLPGSGKSTWFKRHNILPLSSDMVRILLFDDVTEQRYQDLVFSTLRSMLRARLLAKRPWNYVDATNLSPHERRSWVKLAHDFGYEAHAVFFDVPAEVCMERNHRRERNVPEDVMRRMAAKLRPPKFEEGFAKITVVRLKKKDDEAGTATADSSQPEMGEPNPDDVPKVVDSDY
jgi:predicted kinase